VYLPLNTLKNQFKLLWHFLREVQPIFGPGLFATGCKKKLGQPFIVLNVPGAGGALGLSQAYNEKPDGYNLVTTGSYVTSNILQKKVPYGLLILHMSQ
jgi:hypothetical protein